MESWQTWAWLRPRRRPRQGSCRGPDKGLVMALRSPRQGSCWGSRGFPWQGSRQGLSSSGSHPILRIYDLYKDLHATTEVPPEPWLQCVGVLGTGVPRLACLRHAAWLKGGPARPIFTDTTLKTLARGQASRGGRHKASSGASSPGRLARRRRDQGKEYLARCL